MLKRVTRNDLIFLFLFILGTGMIFYKCPFGYSYMPDESYYLTIPYRLFQGDALLTEEWHLSQLNSFLIYPFMLLHQLFFSGTEGILLHFRYIYTALHTLTTLFLYLRLRPYRLFGVGAAILYLLFTPFGIMALCYDSIGVACTTITGVLLATNREQRAQDFYFAGLFFAGAVLCSPYLMVGYLLYAAFCIFRRDWRPLLWFTLGCGTLALLFGGFVLSRASISDILNSLPYILQDPDHPVKSLSQALWRYCASTVSFNVLAIPTAILAAVLSGAIWFDRKSPARQRAYGLAAGVLALCYGIPFLSDPYLNLLMFCPFILGWFAFLLAPRENRVWFLSTWVLSLVYGFCINWSSNQGFYVISMACAVGAVGSWIMVSNWLDSCPPSKANRWMRGAFLGFLALFLVVEGSMRYNALFWESAGMDEMTQELTQGAEAGIFTTRENKEVYDALYQDTQVVRDLTEGPVLYYTTNTVLYLCDSKENASYSSWTYGVNQASADKLLAYYEQNPEKIPAAIYCMKADSFSEENIVPTAISYGYTLQETQLGYLLLAPAQQESVS